MPARAENVLLTGLDQRWKEYQTRFKACRREFSEEAVHDLRVGARRLLGALDIIRTMDSHRGVQKARRAVKTLLDHLDELRDVHVLLIEVSKPPEPWTQLSLFQAELEKRERQLLRRARQNIQASRPSDNGKRIKKIRARLVKVGRQQGFPARLLQAADNLYLRATKAAAQIDMEQATGLHRARIAFKKFRYVAEIIGPLAPHYPKAHFRGMHDFQSAMGDIRDVEVFLSALTDFSHTVPRPAVSGASEFDQEPIRRAYEKRHAGLVATYLEERDRLKTFWRAAPEQAFPWEKNDDPIHHPSRRRRGGGLAGSRGARQPASADGPGPQENEPNRNGTEGAPGFHGPDPEQSVPAHQANGAHPGEEV